ncbi:MAG: DUF2975 domain-containing protein [Alkalibacterium sp.]|uniref:DUF2975 domain-containing protein n=1 Tax=Alkalibacterium sp. TaxID=1872447 RepID=UPI003970F81D
MNIKRFRTVSKLLSFSLKLIGAFCIVIILIGIIFTFFIDNVAFIVGFPENSLILFQDSRVTEADHAFTSLIIAPLFLAVYSYILFKGSFLFDHLANGETPFTFDFAESVKWISFLLITFDIILPLLYSLIVNLRADEGFYFNFGLTSSFFIGLILYIVSGVLKYGISLQELSDDTI